MSETKSNTLLGAFVLTGLLIAIGIAMFTIGKGFQQGDQQIVMVFDSSVKGLEVGAPVALRGVNIGQVTDIRLNLEGTDGLNLLMEVSAVVDESRVSRSYDQGASLGPGLVNAGLRAQLNSQSLLTGLLYVQLDFFPDTPIIRRASRTDDFEIAPSTFAIE